MHKLAIRDQIEHAAAHEPRACVMLTPDDRRALLRGLDSEADLPLRGKIERACVVGVGALLTLSMREIATCADAARGSGLALKMSLIRDRLIARAETMPALAP